MDSQRHSGQRLADVLRLGQCLEKVASGHVEDIETARVGRVDHPHRGHAVRGGRAEPPYSLEAVRVRVVHGEPEAKVLRIPAHLGTSLDTTVSADRDEAALDSSYEPERESKVI